jgi:hypothetical protein
MFSHRHLRKTCKKRVKIPSLIWLGLAWVKERNFKKSFGLSQPLFLIIFINFLTQIQYLIEIIGPLVMLPCPRH